MPRINRSELGQSSFQQLFHNEVILQKWNELSESISTDGVLTEELKENVRRVLAQGNGCVYCQAKGRPLKPKDIKESYAIAFAEVFLAQRENIADTFFVVLSAVFRNGSVSLFYCTSFSL